MSAQEEARTIADDLRELGVRQGGPLLVHSSLSSMGWVEGGPTAVIDGLKVAVGDEGTLLLPALSYEFVSAHSPVFDVRTTPSCVGAITETFRIAPGVSRSLHPTHSVCAIGPLTEEMLEGHHLDDTPVGPRSPFRRLRDRGGQILMLGCGLGPNTSMHGVEELSEPPYLFLPRPVEYTLIDHSGAEISHTGRRHAFAGYRQRYDRVEGLMSAPDLRSGRVHGAPSWLIEASALWEVAADTIARDTYHFVEAVR
jgi:aminoglycoside 3-N-acetyltransferase